MNVFLYKSFKKHVTLLTIFAFEIIGLIFIVSGCKDYTSESHIVNSNPINSVNTGFIVQSEDGTIYFQDGKNNNNIVQLSEFGEVVFDDTYGMCLSLYDKYLYYRNYGNGSQLMRLEIANPDNRETISDINTYQTIIVDEMIYANVVDMESDKEGLYRIRIDGTEYEELVTGSVSNICSNSEEDYLLYVNEGSLYAMDLDTREIKRILNEEINWVNVIDDIIYALDWKSENKDSVIYRIDMHNSETTILGE